MIKIKIVLKTIFYFASLIMPAYDAVKGVISGVKQAAKEKAYQKEVRDIYKYIETETVDELSELEEEDK